MLNSSRRRVGVILCSVTAISAIGISVSSFNPANAATSSNFYTMCGQKIVGVNFGELGPIRQTILKRAGAYCGHPYIWAATAPNNGVDCSGLVMSAYSYHSSGPTAGIGNPNVKREYALTHRADHIIMHQATQLAWGDAPKTPAKLANGSNTPKPGDVVAFSSNGGSTYHHIAIYLGGKKILHAPESGDVVKVSSMRYNETERWGRITYAGL